MSPKPINVANYLKQQLAMSEKSQKDIAREVGFNQPNNISMIKDGISKLPINRVPAMAKALNVDPIHLLRITMREYMPETWAVIESVLGGRLITKAEIALLNSTRKASRNLDLDFTEPEIASAIQRTLEPFVEKELKDRETGIKLAKAEKSAKLARAR